MNTSEISTYRKDEMNDDVIVRVQNVSKTFKLYKSPRHRFLEAFHPLRQKFHFEHLALRDISFELRKGDSVGILGKNGAGKSTLLKIITGVQSPSNGKVEVKGKIAALLELGAGFNKSLTGLENIYFQGALLGFSEEEMKGKVQEIIDFAEIGEYINQPVKTYSSGMFARLAFSIAVSVDPEVLIVDEALSVGDAFFKAKCYAKFQKFLEMKKVIIFVSHSSQEILKNCNKAIHLMDGKIKSLSSDVKSVVLEYEQARRNFSQSSRSGNTIEKRFGSGGAYIADIKIYNSASNDLVLTSGQPATLDVKLKSSRAYEFLVLGVSLKTPSGIVVWGANTVQGIQKLSISEGEWLVRFQFNANLSPGSYLLYAGLADFANGREELDQRWEVSQVEVVSAAPPPEGFVFSDLDIQVTEVS